MGRKLSPEKQKIENEKRKWDQAVRELRFCPEPTYQFEVGDTIKIGKLQNISIMEKYFDGKLYKVEYDISEMDEYGRKTGNTVRETNYYLWYKLRPQSNYEGESFIRNQDVRLHFMHMSISSILNKKYFFGIDMDPDYQRGYVWDQEDKEKLIDSIFNNIDIGKFVFIHKRYSSSNEPLYEILDGKQRVTTLCEFYENKFPYKDRYFNDLSDKDRWHFLEYGISVAEVEEADKKTILKYFLMLNTGGKPMDEKHLNKVKEMIQDVY